MSMTKVKRTFDDIAVEGLTQETKQKEKEAISNAFKQFVDTPLPVEVGAYEFVGTDLLIQVFSHISSDKASDPLEESRNTRYFSLAKVIAAGDASRYKAGDIVKLRDIDVLSVESSAYKMWSQNELTKSNAKAKGEEPPRYISNIYEKLGKFSFLLNPLDVINIDLAKDDSYYKVTDGFVENKVVNLNILL